MLQLVTTVEGQQNRRHVVRLGDGHQVECVVYRGDTLCVSTQVGCAVACPFCASGANGLSRNLRLDELVAQVELVLGHGVELRRVTLSGIGEPLHNPATLEFVAWCRARGVLPSVTTSGGPTRRLPELLSAHHNGVTISVHSGTEVTRARMVPRGPSLEDLFGTLSETLPTLSNHRRRKVALSYLVIEGHNDGDAEFDAFLERAVPLGRSLHLFAYNDVPTSDMRPVSRARYEALYARAAATGLRVHMSSTARLEANGGCGTLVALRAGARGPALDEASTAGAVRSGR